MLILLSGISSCRAQLLTVPKLPERKSARQLLMSVQSCLTCYELAARAARATAKAAATIIFLAGGIKNTYSLWAMPFPLHLKLLLQLLFVFPWWVLSCWRSKVKVVLLSAGIHLFLFSWKKIPKMQKLGIWLMALQRLGCCCRCSCPSLADQSNRVLKKKNPPSKSLTVNHFK